MWLFVVTWKQQSEHSLSEKGTGNAESEEKCMTWICGMKAEFSESQSWTASKCHTAIGLPLVAKAGIDLFMQTSYNIKYLSSHAQSFFFGKQCSCQIDGRIVAVLTFEMEFFQFLTKFHRWIKVYLNTG